MSIHDVESILINYMDPQVCDICRMPIDQTVEQSNELGAAGVSCCNFIFHFYCLTKNQEYSQTCPRCDHHYEVNTENPFLTKWIHSSSGSSDVEDLYSRVFLVNPQHLLLLDESIQKNVSITKYQRRFGGCYDFLRCRRECGAPIIQSWHNFTYGLLQSYDWNYTYATGRAVYSMAHGSPAEDSIDEPEHIYVVICHTDYRIVRKQLQTLLECIEHQIKDNCYLHIENEIIVVHARGLVRKICIYIDYHLSPFTLLYDPPSHFPTYGILYHPAMTVPVPLQATIKAITGCASGDGLGPLASLNKVFGYHDSIELYSSRIKNIILDREFLLSTVYPDYRLRVTTGKIDNIRRKIVENIMRCGISDIIDVDVVKTDNVGQVGIEIVTGGAGGAGGSESGAEESVIPVSTTLLHAPRIKRSVVKVIYQKHVTVRRTTTL